MKKKIQCAVIQILFKRGRSLVIIWRHPSVTFYLKEGKPDPLTWPEKAIKKHPESMKALTEDCTDDITFRFH